MDRRGVMLSVQGEARHVRTDLRAEAAAVLVDALRHVTGHPAEIERFERSPAHAAHARREDDLVGARCGPADHAVSAINSRAAAIGPTIGPCCYEVGPELAERFVAEYGADVVRGGNLDLWTVSERALRRAGCDTVERLDLCTRCNAELFFSERRTGKPRGTHGVIGLVA